MQKIHGLTPIPPIDKTTVQNVSLFDVLGRGMIGDLLGEGESINIAVEVQKSEHAGYAVRGTLTSSNVMRIGWVAGNDYTKVPDVIGINILGFRLPQLQHRKMFCSRIVRAEYESKEPFLAEKYSDYYIELPKLDDWKKEDLSEEYHDLWDLCCIFRTKVKKHDEVIRVESISSPVALELSQEVKKTVAPSQFVNDTLTRRGELLQLQDYFNKMAQEAAQKAAQKAAQSAEIKAKEEMIIIALQSGATSATVSTMQKSAEITDSRLEELKKQAQKSQPSQPTA